MLLPAGADNLKAAAACQHQFIQFLEAHHRSPQM
jgi:hypothetical protein